MAGKLAINQVQLGDHATPANNFVLQTNMDGTAKLARGNAGATTQDILTVDAAGNINAPVSIQKAGSVLQALSDFSGSNVSLATNGYQRLPSGLIVQWGSASPSSTTLNFPVAFPSACVSLLATCQNDANAVAANTEYQAIAYVVSASQFRLRTGTLNTVPLKWVAIGY